MEIIRNKQKLDTEMDVIDMKEYQLSGSIHVDFREDDTNFWARLDYEFLNNLSIGDEIMLTNEDTTNLSPFVISIELDDINYRIKVLTITRKIYSPTGLDVYVLISDDIN